MPPSTRGPSAATGGPPRGETQILKFTNSNSPPNRQQAARFLGREYLPEIKELTPEEQTRFVEKIDQIFQAVDSQNARLVTAFGNVCSATGELPTSAVLFSELNGYTGAAGASRGLMILWQDNRGDQVAIKAFPILPAQELKMLKEILWKLVPMWRRLIHENVLPFRGVDMTSQPALVYDWGKNGNIVQYTTSNPHASRPSLLLGVAKGLEYLHSLDILHGNLKGANVIIDQGGRARVTEYGLAPINSNPSFTVAATPGAVGASRWLAPELIHRPRSGSRMPATVSKAADVFAFGMLAVEVFTGKIPFEGQKNKAAEVQISQGGRPERPRNARTVGLTEGMWKLIEDCWQQDPRTRPGMEKVVRRLEACIADSDGDSIVREELQPVRTQPEVLQRGMQVVDSPPTPTRKKFCCF